MFYPSTYPLSWDMTRSSPLPNIHPEDIDCIVRSQNPLKGSLYVSNLQGAQNLLTLQKLKISSIVTCAAGYKLDHPIQIIRYYKYIPFDKVQTYGSFEYFDQAADFINGALLKSNLMVHCLTGCGRAIVILIAFLIKYNSMSYQDAYQYLQKKRKFINFDKGYQKYLKEYQNKIQINTQQNSNKKLITQRQNLKTLRSLNKGIQNTINKGNKVYSFSDKKSQDIILSRNKTLNNSIKNKQISKDFINQSINQTSKHFKNSNENQLRKSKNSFHQSKISKNNRINSSISHVQPQQFQRILSSSHNQFITVKRNIKNSSMSEQKQQRSSLLKLQIQNKVSDISSRQSNRLKSSNISNFNPTQQRSLRNQLTKTNNSYVSQKLNTQRSESVKSFSSSVKINIHNPEDRQSVMLKKSQNSISHISQSKIQYFQKINDKITDNINQIITQFETDSKNAREKYYLKLRNLRLNPQSFNPQAIY